MMSGVDSQHLGEVEFVTHRLQGCCCDQDHRSSFASSSSSTSSSGASNSSSNPPPPTPTLRKAKNLEAFLGLRDSGPGSSSREAAERAALGSLQYQQSLWGEGQGGGGKKNLNGLLGVSEPSPPPPKPGFSLPQFLEATRRVLERRGSPVRLGGLRGVLSPKERWKRAGEKCHSLPRRMARWSGHNNNNNNNSSSGGNHNSNMDCGMIPEKPEVLDRQPQLAHPIFLLARNPSPQPSSSSTAASPNPSPIPPRLRRLGRRELPPLYTPPPAPGSSRQRSPGTSKYQCPPSSPHPSLPKDLPLIPFPSPSPAFPRPPSSLPTRLTTNLVATTSKSLDNIIAEARRELAEERSYAMTTSAESVYTTMVGPLASSSSAPSGYPSYLSEPKTGHPDYLDMDRLTSFVSGSLK